METVHGVISAGTDRLVLNSGDQQRPADTLQIIEDFVARTKRLPRAKNKSEADLNRSMKQLYEVAGDDIRDRLMELGYCPKPFDRERWLTKKLVKALEDCEAYELRTKDRPLYDWLCKKRKEFRKKTLWEVTEKALREAGLFLDADEEWKHMLSAGQQWVRGHRFDDERIGKRVGAWVHNRRLDVRLNRIDPKRIDELTAAGILTVKGTRKEILNVERWNAAYATVLEHYDPALRYFDLLRVLPRKEADWLKAQVGHLRYGRLSAERARLIEELGLPESFETSTRKTLNALASFINIHRRLPRCRQHQEVEYDLYCRLVALNVKRKEHPWLDAELQALSTEVAQHRDASPTDVSSRVMRPSLEAKWQETFDQIFGGRDASILYKDLRADLTPGQRKWLSTQIARAKNNCLSNDRLERIANFGFPETPDSRAWKLIGQLRQFVAKKGHVPRKVHGDEDEAVLAKRLSKIIGASGVHTKTIAEIQSLYRQYPAPKRHTHTPSFVHRTAGTYRAL